MPTQYTRLDENGLLYLLTLLSGEISEAGEENVIETVKVNGTALVPDAQKAVDVAVPTDTSDLTNDGDGQSPFATQEYVQQNGGKIDVIQVNGTAQTITNKTVNIPVPTNVSDLTNDSNFQTDTQVQSAISASIASAVKIKGSVATYDDLPATGNQNGDMYDVLDTGRNYVWIEEAGSTGRWDDYAGTIDLSGYVQASEMHALTNAEIDTIFQQVFGS